MKKLFTLLLLFLAMTVMLCNLGCSSSEPKVDLPEEYKLITESDELFGWFDKDSVLHIAFRPKTKYIQTSAINGSTIIIPDPPYKKGKKAALRVE